MPQQGLAQQRVMFQRSFHAALPVMFLAATLLGSVQVQAAGNTPAAPSGFTTLVTFDSVVLTWEPVVDDDAVEGYNIYRDNRYLTTVSDTRYEGSIEPGTLHTFNVVAFDAEPRNFSPVSDNIFVPEDLVPEDSSIPPSAPAALTGTITNTSVSLSWQASTDDVAVLGYNVYQDDAYITTVASTQYTGTVQSGASHSYYIVAFDARNLFSARSTTLNLPDDSSNGVQDNGPDQAPDNGPDSGPDNGPDNGPDSGPDDDSGDTTIPPSAPTGLAAQNLLNNGSTAVRLTWNDAEDDRGVAGYNVYVDNAYRTTVFALNYEQPVDTGSSYTFSVVAFDIDGNFSAQSAALRVTPSSTNGDGNGNDGGDNNGGNDGNGSDSGGSNNVADTAPDAPTGLTGTLDPNTGNVDISWQAASDDSAVRGYNVYRNNQYITTVSGTRYEGTVDPGPVYAFYVVAFDDTGNFSVASTRLSLPDDVNQAPVFVNLEDQVIEAGPVWQLRIEPTDIDGPVPGLFIGTLPVGMVQVDNFDGTRSLRWQPLQPDVGEYRIELTALDAVDPTVRTTETLTVQVVLPDDPSIIPNRAPTIDAVPDYVVRAGDPIVLRVKAVDANGTVPDLTLLNPPAGASFTPLAVDPRIRELRFQSDAQDAGPVVFNFMARDADDPSLTASSSATLDFRAADEFLLEGSRLKTLANQAGISIGYASVLEITAFPDGALYNEIAANEFDLVTPENSMKWSYVNPERDEFRFEDADRLVDFAAQNGMDVHGHALVWYAQLPQWVQQSEVGERESLMNGFIDLMTARYPDVAIWDVVNEAFEDDGSFRNSIWFEAMGEQHIDKAFRRARQGDPQAELIYNDYDVAAGGPKTDAMFALVQRLLAEDVPIDGVGFQMHLDTDYRDFAAVTNTFQRFADLGLDIYITELDVNRVDGDSLEDQAAVFKGAVQACLAQAACRAIQTWGFTDRYTWRSPNTPQLLDKAYQAKPAYRAVQDALAGQ